MSEQNLRKLDGIISKNKEADVTISGEPYYQVYKNFDFWLKFNTQFSNEEKNIKLLLSLPLIPKSFHNKVKLLSSKDRKMSVLENNLKHLN